MTPENMLLTALSAVTSALVFVARILWRRSETCEQDRRALYESMLQIKQELGKTQGALSAIQSCHVADCPHRTVLTKAQTP